MYGTTEFMPVAQNRAIQGSEVCDWTHDDVREELGRILGSRFFIKSERLSSFLRTAVSYLLDGKSDHFKEYTVGTEVYKRPSTYDPTQDSIVRTEARRLRAKLKEYYSSGPAWSSIMIQLTAGSYIPVIQTRSYAEQTPTPDSADYGLMSPRDEALRIGVIPFNARSADKPAQTLAFNIEDELTHELSQCAKMKVFRTPLGVNPDPMGPLRAWDRSGVQLVLQGCINPICGGSIVRIQLTTISGMIVWSGRFDRDTLDERYQDISAAVLAAVLDSTTLGGQSRVSAEVAAN